MSDPTTDPGLLVQLGIRTQDLVAGFGGGVVNALVFRTSDPVSIISSMIVGALTANYLTESVATYLGTSPHASGFLVGLAGMAICQTAVEAAKRWQPFSKESPK